MFFIIPCHVNLLGACLFVNSGFRASDGNSTVHVQCGDDGRWIMPNSTCEPNACGYAPAVKNARVLKYSSVTEKDGTVTENAIYKCKYGYWISNGLYKVTTYYNIKIKCNQFFTRIFIYHFMV